MFDTKRLLLEKGNTKLTVAWVGSVEVRATSGRFHNNRASNEESMEIGIPTDFDLLKTMRLAFQL